MHSELELLADRIAWEVARAEDGRGSWTEGEWIEALARLKAAAATATPDELAQLDFDFLIATQLHDARIGRVVVRAWKRGVAGLAALLRPFTERHRGAGEQVRSAHRPDADAAPPLAQLVHSIERTGPPGDVSLMIVLEGSATA